jgi:diaminopimelate decarboxylase
MDHFNYTNGVLCAENVPVAKIANDIGTPFYVYSAATLSRHYKVFTEAFSEVDMMLCYAVKANSNLAVLSHLGSLGAGADTVSEGEIRKARAAGIPADKIVFSGVGKSRDEIRYALGINIAQFNVESREELEMINKEASALGVKANVAVRVNPDVDAKTHDKISTGRKTDKFGVAWADAMEVYADASKLSHLNIVGVTTHIGSQLTDLEPFKQAFDRVKMLVEALREAGHTIERLDLGGGLGIPYENEVPPSPEAYANMIVGIVKELNCKLILEPGRLIAGNAGILVTKILRLKHTPERVFMVIDAGMNDMTRPSMYGSYHDVVPAKEPKEGGELLSYDVVGPVCESSDVFGRQRSLPQAEVDDLVALRSCGAYGATMSSTYNTRPLIAEVMVKDDRFEVVRARQTYAELLGLDTIPDWS